MPRLPVVWAKKLPESGKIQQVNSAMFPLTGLSPIQASLSFQQDPKFGFDVCWIKFQKNVAFVKLKTQHIGV